MPIPLRYDRWISRKLAGVACGQGTLRSTGTVVGVASRLSTSLLSLGVSLALASAGMAQDAGVDAVRHLANQPSCGVLLSNISGEAVSISLHDEANKGNYEGKNRSEVFVCSLRDDEPPNS